MTMQFGCYTDTLDETSDQTSTLLLLNDLVERGHEVYVSFPQDVRPDQVVWRSYEGVSEPFDKLNTDLLNTNFPVIGEINSFDSLLFRKDQPLDTSQVSRIGNLYPQAVQINRGSTVASLDKTYLKRFPEFTAKTYFSRDLQEIHEYIFSLQDAIIKPTDEGGGTGVSRVGPDSPGLESRISELTQNNQKEIAIQEFLPGVYQGDKRIMLLGNKVIDQYTRIPAAGSYMANIKQGATAHPTEVTDREQEIIEAILPQLQLDGLVNTGLDFITDAQRGPLLNEVNGVCVGFSALRDGERYRRVTDAVLQTVEDKQQGLFYTAVHRAS